MYARRREWPEPADTHQNRIARAIPTMPAISRIHPIAYTSITEAVAWTAWGTLGAGSWRGRTIDIERGEPGRGAMTSTAPMTVMNTAAIAASLGGLLGSLSLDGAGRITPRSAAQEAANDRGSNALLPSTSSAEAPSASASWRSAARSAAISLATGSGTRSRFHSRRHSSMNLLTAVPPLRRDPARHRRHHAPPAIRTRRPRAHDALHVKDGSTSA